MRASDAATRFFSRCLSFKRRVKATRKYCINSVVDVWIYIPSHVSGSGCCASQLMLSIACSRCLLCTNVWILPRKWPICRGRPRSSTVRTYTVHFTLFTSGVGVGINSRLCCSVHSCCMLTAELVVPPSRQESTVNVCIL